jgi:hypothetical protein
MEVCFVVVVVEIKKQRFSSAFLLWFLKQFVNGGELFHHLQREKRFEERMF